MKNNKCIHCNEREKTGYKYCNICKKLIKKKNDMINQKARKEGKRKMCTRCGIEPAASKYCKKCVQIVRHEYDKNRYWGERPQKTKIEKPIADKWLVRGKIL